MGTLILQSQVENTRSIYHDRETQSKKGDGHFQVLEDNLVMSPEEVGSEFRRGVWGLRLDPQIFSKRRFTVETVQ